MQPQNQHNPPSKDDNKILEILGYEINNQGFISNLQYLARERGNDEFLAKIDRYSHCNQRYRLLDPKEGCLTLLEENLAYSSVGIFCLSDIKVLEGDAAQLMFAHYGGNLEGLALIYALDTASIE